MEIPLLKPDAKEQSLNVCEVRRRMRLCCKDRCPPHLLLELQVSQKCESEVIQSCLTLCNPMDCSLPGSPIHGIFQARVLEWVAISFSRDRTQVSRIVIAGRRFTVWATREVQASQGLVITVSSFRIWNSSTGISSPPLACTEDRDQDHPHGKEMQKSKMAV